MQDWFNFTAAGSESSLGSCNWICVISFCLQAAWLGKISKHYYVNLVLLKWLWTLCPQSSVDMCNNLRPMYALYKYIFNLCKCKMWCVGDTHSTWSAHGFPNVPLHPQWHRVATGTGWLSCGCADGTPKQEHPGILLWGMEWWGEGWDLESC